MRTMSLWTIGLIALAGCAADQPPAVPPTVGRLFVERPTLHCLGVRWYLDDADPQREASCALDYRKVGERRWRQAQPLLRIGGEHVGRGTADIEWVTPQMLAGSVLGLDPGTDYELRLTLTGVGAEPIVHALRSRTRTAPRGFQGGKTVEVRPGGSIRDAYAQAQPGDVVLIHAGAYRVPEADKIGRTDYVFDKQATAERPIVFRAAPGDEGQVILDGEGALTLIDCQRAAYHYFEGLIFEDADHAIYAGRVAGAAGLSVVRCTFRDTSHGVFAVAPQCRDYYIADSTFIGPAVDQWHPRDESRKASGDTHAIWLMGQGHVVCHNRITGWWDGVDIVGRKPDDDPALQNAAIDFYANEISECIDDAIELDYGAHNVRAWQNLIYNTFMGISAQPVYGGPAYVIRNVVYNCTRSPIKPNQWPAGLLIYHNTFVCADSAGRWATMWQNSRIMNNLFLGADDAPGVIWTGTPTPDTSTLDYNGWRLHRVSEPMPFWFRFETDPSRERAYPTMEAFVEETGYERHATPVDYDVFVACPPPSGQMGPLPAIDLRLREGGAAIDRALPLPNVNDNFTGVAPDLGACELGAAPPHYGPRP